MNWRDKIRGFLRGLRDPYIQKLIAANLGLLALTAAMMVMMVKGVLP